MYISAKCCRALYVRLSMRSSLQRERYRLAAERAEDRCSALSAQQTLAITQTQHVTSQQRCVVVEELGIEEGVDEGDNGTQRVVKNVVGNNSSSSSTVIARHDGGGDRAQFVNTSVAKEDLSVPVTGTRAAVSHVDNVSSTQVQQRHRQAKAASLTNITKQGNTSQPHNSQDNDHLNCESQTCAASNCDLPVSGDINQLESTDDDVILCNESNSQLKINNVESLEASPF